MLALERSIEVTDMSRESHLTPNQLQGVSSRELSQEERTESGSERVCFTRCKYRPSWLRERVGSGGEKTRKMNR